MAGNQTSSINIYDLNELEKKSYTITKNGKKNIMIKISELLPEIYVYSLIADGEVIDIKRMILTD